jgi:hypothetical protein
MTNLRRFLVVSTLLSISSLSAASAAGLVAGDYKLAVGSAAPCTITLAADGTASVGACAGAPNVGYWKQRGSTIELSMNSGEVFALLHTKGDAYAGSTIPSNHTLTLTPTAQTAALSH